ncbi:MAG: Fur family transcriptional regulator [Candidatus Promineifilaceae bacterium]
MTLTEEIISDLRDSGYRITPQRELIIRAIAESGRHMPVEDIYAAVQEQTSAVNLATIYRTLEMLWEEGLVHRNDLHEGKLAYAVAEHGPHLHLVCRRCKRVIDVDPDILAPLQAVLREREQFEADLEHLSLFGLCIECRD